MKHIYTITFLFLVVFVPLQADDVIRNYIHISKSEGLANNNVSVIGDDIYGRIWIGTTNGLNIYDSNHLKNVEGYSGLHIFSLYDTGKEMLIGTSDFLEAYNYETGVYNRVRYNGNELAYALSVCNYQGDIIIVANGSTYLYENDSVSVLKSNVPYIYLSSDKFGVLWGINNTNTVYKLNESFEIVKTYRLEKSEYSSLKGVCLFPDSKGCVWVGTVKDGLYRYNRVTDDFYKEDLVSMYNIREIDNIVSINEDKYDRLWIGHDNKVSIYDYNNNFFKSYMFENSYNITLNTTVTKIHRTKDNYMTLGSFFTGFFYVKELDSNMKFYNVAGERKESGGVTANGIVKDAQGRIWVGTNCMGISQLDKDGRNIRQWTSANSGINSDIIAMEIDYEGNIWGGSRSNGLYRISKNGAVTHFMSRPDNEGSLSDNSILALRSINEDSLVVASNGGIDIYLHKTNTFSNIKRAGIQEFAFCDILTHRNKVYLVNFNSVYCFDRSTGSVEEYSFIENNVYFYSAYMDKEGRCWLGTSRGEIFTLEGGKLVPYISDRKLIDSGVAGIEGDSEGNIWITSGNSLLRVTPDKKIRKFNISWGLGTKEFTARSSYVDKDGILFFGSSNGLFSFDPKAVDAQESRNPALFISDFKILNSSVKAQEGGILEKHINNTDKLVLNNNQNFISFDVTRIDYNSSYLKPYKCVYQLENFDKNWYEVNPGSNEISFTGLTTGKYVLHIQLIADNGEILDAKNIDIQVKPPFWLNPFMILAYLVVLVLIGWVISIFFRKQRLAKKLVKQAKAEKEEVNKLNALKLDFFTYISHEFKTPLSIISTLQDEILPAGEEPDNETVIFKRNVKRLEYLINQLMDFRNIESQYTPVEIRQYDIVPFLRNIYEAFDPLYNHKEITHRFLTDVESLPLLMDADKIEMLVGNLLSNTFKHTQEGGDCYLKISANEEYVVVDVFNSGICFTEAQKTEIFQPYKRTNTSVTYANSGIGLAIVNSIAKLMDIRLSVIGVENQGNIFRVEIPLIKDDNVKISIPKGNTAIVDRIIDNTMFIGKQSGSADDGQEMKREFQILVVDNDNDTRKILKKKLQESYNVLVASSGKEALLLMKAHNVDVVISDIRMPEMDGYELCKTIKENSKTRHIPFIMISADLSTESKIKGFQYGADAFIQKPINIQELLLRLDNILRNKNVLRAYYAGFSQLDIEKAEVNNADEIFIKELTEYIYGHLGDNNLSVQQLAQHVNISRTQLYLNIKRLTDHTPSSFVLSIKMKEAKKLMLTTGMTSSEISYKLGYCNPNHFSRQFKEYYNVSPSEFRKQQQVYP